VCLVLFIKALCVVTITAFGGNLGVSHPIIQRHNVIFKSLFVCLLGPLIEELAFRLPLSNKKSDLLFSIPFLVLLLYIFLNKIIQYEIALFASLCASVFLFYTVLKLYDFNENSFFIIHFLTLLFALSHWNNTKDLAQVNSFNRILVYILPMLIGGYFFALIRLKYGFMWALITHCIHNIFFSIPILIKILSKYF
jgi:hypothetical protein